jgi:cell division transport system permease protein
MTFVSIITITATLLLICGVFIGLMNIDEILGQAGDQPDIIAYLTESAAADMPLQSSLIDTIKKMPEVREVGIVSKDSARFRFETMYGSEMFDAVDENPLPASLEIFLYEGSQSAAAASELHDKISYLAGIESINYSNDWLERIKKLRDLFYVVSFAAGVVILLALHAIVSNTIKLTIYARKDLVRNMHYVGATDLFIKMPFLLEGMLQGFIGGILCVCVMVAARFFLSSFFLSNIFIDFNWYFSYLPFIVVIGVLFGWLGSRLAVSKFLI